MFRVWGLRVFRAQGSLVGGVVGLRALESRCGPWSLESRALG